MDIFCRGSIILFLSISFSLAQIPDTLWTKTFGGSGYDFGEEVHRTSDGGYIVVGTTYSFGAGNADAWLLRTDVNGDTTWTKTYGCQWWDEGYSIEKTLDGGYIITGYTESSGTSMDVWLIKTNALGDTLWTKTYGGNNGEDVGWEVKQTADSGYVIVGTTGSFGAGYWDIWLLKTDSSGDTLWTKTYGGASIEEGISVIQTIGGGYVITGCTESYGTGAVDIWLIRTNAQGDTIWTRTYGGSSDDLGSEVIQTTDGAYVIVGSTNSFGVGQCDIWLLKVDSLGDTLWNRTLGSAMWDEGHSVKQTFDDGYIIVGFTGDFFAADGYAVKTDSLGNVLWTKSFTGSDNDFLRSVKPTFDGGYIMIGYTYSYGMGLSDLWLIKTEPDTFGIKEQQITSIKNDYHSSTIISGPLQLPEGKKCKVFDITGRVVEPTNITRGIYFIEIDGVVTQKVVKVR